MIGEKKEKMHFRESAVPLLEIYPKTLYSTETYTLMFTATLFTIARLWKLPQCPTVEDWIKKTGLHVHSGILFSCMKR